MATKLSNLALEKAHFNNIYDFLPNAELYCKKTVDMFLNQGLIQVSSAVEAAIATVGGYTVISEDHADLSDGSEVKLATVRIHREGTSYGAPVTNTKNKTGDLRVQVYERKQNKFYYFNIPHWAYSQVGSTSNIEIPFYLNGDPMENYKPRKLPNWWNFRTDNFVQMSLK